MTRQRKLKLPGYNRPLHAQPCKEQFAHPLDSSDLGRNGGTSLPLYTLRELNMMRLMNQLTDKVDWNRKVFDKDICSKWKEEALGTKGIDMTEKMVDFCFEELRYKAKTFEKKGIRRAFNADVVKSDSIIPDSLREELIAAAAPLENIPAHLQDWHPGSNDMVLDLVHPSLFPLVYGRSHILPNEQTNLSDCIERCGQGMVLPTPKPGSNNSSDNEGIGNRYSRKFQWLPCDIAFSDSSVRIQSYINNLHPTKFAGLYRVIEKIIGLAIPLWNVSLTAAKHNYHTITRIPYYNVVYDPHPQSWPETEGPQKGETEDEWSYRERRGEWISSVSKVVQPEPVDFQEPKLQPKLIDLRKEHAQKGLQVIVKLANIHLTPEKPEYAGGAWHVEGQLNEHICASAIYYYSTENISSSQLGFRQQSDVTEADHIENPHSGFHD